MEETSLTKEPLPLVPIERFLLKSDDPQHPMVFRVLLQFEGSVQQDLLSAAFRQALARQPLLTRSVSEFKGSASWKCLEEALPELHWQSIGPPPAEIAQLPIASIPLAEGPGIFCRAWPTVSEDGSGLVVLLDLHHACCDGQGARQFLAEWFGAYAQLVQRETWSPKTLNAARLKERATYRTITPPVGAWEGLRNFYNTIRGRTVRLPENFPDSLPAEFLSERLLTSAETARLREQAQSRGMRINDLGLTAAFAAFAQTWPELCRRHWITVLHPVDVRWPSDLRTPACNRVGVAFLRRRGAACREMHSLREGVRDEMAYIKRRYLGAEFLRGLAAIDRFPMIAKRFQSWGWFVPTLQFTCLGNTTRMLPRQLVQPDGGINVGGLQLDHISGFMQRGSRLPISLTACETNHRLSLTARICQRSLSAAEAQKFFDCFVEKIFQAGESV